MSAYETWVIIKITCSFIILHLIRMRSSIKYREDIPPHHVNGIVIEICKVSYIDKMLVSMLYG